MYSFYKQNKLKNIDINLSGHAKTDVMLMSKSVSCTHFYLPKTNLN